METGRTVNSIRNTVTGALTKVILIVLPFIVRTIIIRIIGIEYAGLNSLFTSILQILSFSELGLSTAVAFSLYKPITDGDKETIGALLNLIKRLYYIVGLVILILGVSLMPFLPHLISGTYPADINLYILYSIFLFNTVVSYFLFSYRSVLLQAAQRKDVENVISAINTLVFGGAQILTLLLTKNYYIYVSVIPLMTISENLIRFFVVKKMYPELRVTGSIDAHKKKEVVQKLKELIGHRLCGIIVASTDSVIISSFLGLTAVGVYSNYFFVINALMGFIDIFHASLTASIGNSLIKESREKNFKDFKMLTFVNFWLVGWMSITCLCLYQHFITVWVGEELLLPLSSVILFVVYLYSWKAKDMLCVYKNAAGDWGSDFWKPYVVSALNIVLDIILVNYIGVNGVLLATILSVPVISLPWETHVFFKRVFKEKESLYYLTILVTTVVIVGVGAGTYFLCDLLPSDGFGWLAAKLGICVVVPNAIFLLLSFRLPEFRGLLAKALGLFKKKSD